MFLMIKINVMFCSKTNFFVSKISEIKSCNGVHLYVEGSAYSLPFNISYLKPEAHNLDTCENCRKSLEEAKQNIRDHFMNFPNCCVAHRKLLKEDWFDKIELMPFVDSVAEKIYFVLHHLLDVVENYENWQEEIENYLEYVNVSFGSFPDGYGPAFGANTYYSQLENHIKFYINLPDAVKYQHKFKFILEVIGKFYNFKHKQIPSFKNNFHSEYNILVTTYSKWYNSFPFELEVFKHLKERFQKTLPILAEKPRHNPYLRISKAKLTPTSDFVNYLNEITKAIISAVNPNRLIKEGFITDFDKYQTELICKEYELKQEELFKKFDKSELKYIALLKSWLKQHKAFLQEIRPFIEKNVLKTKTEKHYLEFIPSLSHIALVNFYQGQIINNSNAQSILNHYNNNSTPKKLIEKFSFFRKKDNRIYCENSSENSTKSNSAREKLLSEVIIMLDNLGIDTSKAVAEKEEFLQYI